MSSSPPQAVSTQQRGSAAVATSALQTIRDQTSPTQPSNALVLKSQVAQTPAAQKLEEQREFIASYIQRYQDERGLPLPPRTEMHEMESVLYSVSFGRQEIQKKVTYQAFSAAISTQSHVDMVLKYICQKQRINQAKCKILAYRVANRPVDTQSQRTFLSEVDENGGLLLPNIVCDFSISIHLILTEGFDDSGEDGSGEKLLHLLQKMGVENIMIIVCVWHSNMPGQYGTETYKMVLDRAKDLLSSLHLKVLEAEKVAQQEELALKQKQLMLTQQPKSGNTSAVGKSRQLLTANGGPRKSDLQTVGMEVVTKVYSSNVIPDHKEQFHVQQSYKKNYRPNNFLSELPYQALNTQQHLAAVGGKGTIVEEEEQLEIELTEDEFQYAVKMTDQSIRRLTKAHIGQ